MSEIGKVWLVYAGFDHEGACVLRAFASEESAIALRDACEAHIKARPPWCDVEPEAPDDDPRYLAFDAAWKEWERLSPLGDQYVPEADRFSVHSQDVFP